MRHGADMSRRSALQPTLWRIDPHTTIKHLVYRHYLDCWLPVILQKFPTATIVDGFSGPGQYEDGADGSPVIAAKAYLTHRAVERMNSLTLICQEARADRSRHLRAQLVGLHADSRLNVDVRPAGAFDVDALKDIAHKSNRNQPVLWILDPYNFEPVPFRDVVVRCLEGPRDEVLLTFFVDEVYRFRRSHAHEAAITRYLGTDAWLLLRDVTDEAVCKRQLIQLYETNLQSETGTYVGHFNVAVKNQTPRYSIVFATHAPKGMDCWSPVTWRLDERSGEKLALKPEQLDIFAPMDLSPAEQFAEEMRAFAGHEMPWANLVEAARTWNFLEKHLREALTLLGEQGLTVRVEPLKSRTPWPEGSVVRFYDPSDIEEA
jgi:three-Cys-motif partner protein